MKRKRFSKEQIIAILPRPRDHGTKCRTPPPRRGPKRDRQKRHLPGWIRVKLDTQRHGDGKGDLHARLALRELRPALPRVLAARADDVNTQLACMVEECKGEAPPRAGRVAPLEAEEGVHRDEGADRPSREGRGAPNRSAPVSPSPSRASSCWAAPRYQSSVASKTMVCVSPGASRPFV